MTLCSQCFQVFSTNKSLRKLIFSSEKVSIYTRFNDGKFEFIWLNRLKTTAKLWVNYVSHHPFRTPEHMSGCSEINFYPQNWWLQIVMNKVGCSECISKSIFYIKETRRNEITLTVDPWNNLLGDRNEHNNFCFYFYRRVWLKD